MHKFYFFLKNRVPFGEFSCGRWQIGGEVAGLLLNAGRAEDEALIELPAIYVAQAGRRGGAPSPGSWMGQFRDIREGQAAGS